MGDAASWFLGVARSLLECDTRTGVRNWWEYSVINFNLIDSNKFKKVKMYIKERVECEWSEGRSRDCFVGRQ